MRKVEVVPHNPKWHEAYQLESQRIINALDDNVVAVHHIGSTAIAGIYAKPIIDILVEVKDLSKLDGHSSTECLGYEAMGEFGIRERRYFIKYDSDDQRTHHIHIFKAGSPQVERHLAFRDYMRYHSESAKEYSSLKQQLAAKHPQDIDKYMDGKDEFIKLIDCQAAQWRSHSRANLS